MFISIKKADGLRIGLAASDILGVLSFDDDALAQLKAPTRPIGARAILFHSNDESKGVMVTWIDDDAFDIYQKVKGYRNWVLLTAPHGGQSMIRPERIVDVQERNSHSEDSESNKILLDVTFTDGIGPYLATRKAVAIEKYDAIIEQISNPSTDQPPV